MIVNVAFFDENPIENVFTCLHYQIDKMIFFGYEKVMQEHKVDVKRFLTRVCDVQIVEFCSVDEMDLGHIMDVISRTVDAEVLAGNRVFFDLTGGENLILVAFGILSREFAAPMHMYRVPSDQIYEYGYEGSEQFSKIAPYKRRYMNLDEFISLYGGTINYRMHKDFKNTWSEEDCKDIETMWNLSRKYRTKWVYYAAVLRQFPPDESLTVCVPQADMKQELQNIRATRNESMFQRFLKECEALGFLYDVSFEQGNYQFRYKSMAIKNLFWDGGSILEMYVFLSESQNQENVDCRVGVHIDWDGVIHTGSGKDVLNEIDIMAMEHNLPVFISCKIGNVDQKALYELDAVASRFGGKYAKKVLAVTKKMAPGHLLRAKEMGIEIIEL